MRRVGIAGHRRAGPPGARLRVRDGSHRRSAASRPWSPARSEPHEASCSSSSSRWGWRCSPASCSPPPSTIARRGGRGRGPSGCGSSASSTSGRRWPAPSPPDAAQEWRDEVNVLLRGYFQAVTELRNRYPRAPRPRRRRWRRPGGTEGQPGREGPGHPRGLPEVRRLAAGDALRAAPTHGRRLGVAGGLRLDVLAVEPGASPSGGAGAPHRLRALGGAAPGRAGADPGRRPSPARRCRWR